MQEIPKGHCMKFSWRKIKTYIFQYLETEVKLKMSYSFITFVSDFIIFLSQVQMTDSQKTQKKKFF